MPEFSPLDVDTWNLTCGFDNEPCTTRVMCTSGGCRRAELSKRTVPVEHCRDTNGDGDCLACHPGNPMKMTCPKKVSP